MLVSHLAQLMSPKGSCCHVRLICSTLSATSSVSASHLPLQLQPRLADTLSANVRPSSELSVAHFLCLLNLRGNLQDNILLTHCNFSGASLFLCAYPDLQNSTLHIMVCSETQAIFLQASSSLLYSSLF